MPGSASCLFSDFAALTAWVSEVPGKLRGMGLGKDVLEYIFQIRFLLRVSGRRRSEKAGAVLSVQKAASVGGIHTPLR